MGCGAGDSGVTGCGGGGLYFEADQVDYIDNLTDYAQWQTLGPSHRELLRVMSAVSYARDEMGNLPQGTRGGRRAPVLPALARN